MTTDTMIVTTIIDAPADTVFGVLADPATHAAIDGTGWVRESLDGKPIEESDQVFRMGMYFLNPNEPENFYEVANKVVVFDPPHAIAWEPGQDGPNGWLTAGGWIWRYDLAPVSEAQTEVTLTYDWSATSQEVRDEIQFPPFPVTHLENSLGHLAELAEGR
ncbi:MULTISPECIES: polyketide cyclase [unclassified Mycobacterium]|uniref:polyketide cyclase n=1 Tax=unclassified Mycobacterium TaxID=2642494 RepID=UPI0029C64823|nr:MULTISPECIES: polyketide cyclase [unclassified Mycobacterium]